MTVNARLSLAVLWAINTIFQIIRFIEHSLAHTLTFSAVLGESLTLVCYHTLIANMESRLIVLLVRIRRGPGSTPSFPFKVTLQQNSYSSHY